MNLLNSVIIEGNIRENVFKNNGRVNYCETVINTPRYYKEQGELINDDSNFVVLAYGKLGDVMDMQGDVGRGIRVVGRMKEERDPMKATSRIVIIAEHIEFKPRKF